MLCDPNGVEYLNSFALVSYIPGPLAEFLDSLRCELVPNCFLRAHVTILPPRPITSPRDAFEELREMSYGLQPIKIELGDVEVFRQTDVIYISIGDGSEELKITHDVLNKGALYYTEPFQYHPHVTLAQNLTPDQVDELSEVARRRSEAYQGSRSFRIETVTFVQNTRWHGWIDLAELPLGRLVAA